MLFTEFQNSLLVFQVHCTCGGSDEAFGRGENDIAAGRFSTQCYCLAGNAITVTNHYNLAIFKNGHVILLSGFPLFLSGI
jgi:hypothetical protein